jgi:hypothetical protein
MQDCKLPETEGEGVLQKVATLLLVCEELKEGIDYINLSPFDASRPGEHDSLGTSLPHPGSDMVKILQRIVTLQTEGDTSPTYP